MKKKVLSKKDSDIATRGDVKEIVTDVVTDITARIIIPAVTQIVDDKLEKFAGMVDRSFRNIEERMVTKDEFEPFKKSTEQSFYYLQTDVTDLKVRMTSVENRLDTVECKLDTMIDMYQGHEMRIVNLEEKTGVMA